MPLTPDDRKKYKELYLQTAKEYLLALKETSAKLAEGKQSAEIIEIMHRSSHSLKSQSKMMDYNQIGDLSEALEHFFAPYATSNKTIPNEEVITITQAISAMDKCLDSLEQSARETELEQSIEAVKALQHAA